MPLLVLLKNKTLWQADVLPVSIKMYCKIKSNNIGPVKLISHRLQEKCAAQ